MKLKTYYEVQWSVDGKKWYRDFTGWKTIEDAQRAVESNKRKGRYDVAGSIVIDKGTPPELKYRILKIDREVVG